MTTISIDPGIRGSGVAVWSNTGRLIAAQFVGPMKVHEHSHDLLASVTPIVQVALAQCPPEGAAIVIEKPKVYDTKHQKGDQRDIIDLAVFVGALTSALDITARRIRHVEPWQWKGQVPKTITMRRAIETLDALELAQVALPENKKKQLDVWDAVGIGLWSLGRKAPK